MKKSVFIFLALLLTACNTDFLTPPRLATQTAQNQTVTLVTPSPLPPITAPAPLPSPTPPTSITIAGDDSVDALTVWVNETSPDHVAAMDKMATAFGDETGVYPTIIHVNPNLLPDLVETSALSGTLPDLILHPIDYSAKWYAEGILDGEAVTAVLGGLNAGTFNPTALSLLQDPTNPDTIMALPSDAWKQLLVYRTDWFANNNLAPPLTFNAMISASAIISDSANLISGLVVPTESNLLSTAYIFEHWATANGCDLIDTKGEIIFSNTNCIDSLEFYRSIINLYSPSDVQTDISALNTYLEGRTSMIMVSPAVLPILAGLDPANPPRCPECNNIQFLAENSGFITDITGWGKAAQPAGFTQITALGITQNAHPLAQQFAEYWFEDGYLAWLGVEPARKVPLREGISDEPTRYLEAWKNLGIVNNDVASSPTLAAIYGDGIIAILTSHIATSGRWGFSQGQGALIGDISQQKTFSILLQEMLSGYLTTAQTVTATDERVIDLIPDYQYHPTPTATPETEDG
jgi:multiple sugar transport system substrate-binding protein